MDKHHFTRIENPRVGGSIPPPATILFKSLSLSQRWGFLRFRVREKFALGKWLADRYLFRNQSLEASGHDHGSQVN